MLTLENNQLVIRFPDVHPDATCTIDFQRTLRIPDDNRSHPLPPSLGTFPLFHVDDYAARLPEEWSRHGGVFLPMHQSEAMWIRFTSRYPFAVKLAAGKINAVSGEAWTPELQGERWVQPAHDLLARSPREQWEIEQRQASLAPVRQPGKQDYLTLPKQPWLDGFNVGEGRIRQFVAMPLGDGYTVEEQLTGVALHGGLQLIVYPLKPEFVPRPRIVKSSVLRSMSFAAQASSASNASMGLAPGGLMEQKVYEDTFGLAKWDQLHSARCFVHLLNSQQFEKVTGHQPPSRPLSAADYTAHGLPWFALYDEGQKALTGAPKLKQLDSIAALGHKKGEQPLPDNAPMGQPKVVPLANHPNAVREGHF